MANYYFLYSCGGSKLAQFSFNKSYFIKYALTYEYKIIKVEKNWVQRPARSNLQPSGHEQTTVPQSHPPPFIPWEGVLPGNPLGLPSANESY